MPRRAPSAPPAYPRADPQAGDGVGLANRLGGTDRLCETLSSWRLLVGGPSPAASHHSFITSSEEPPLSNFNSYRDIPPGRVLGWLESVFLARSARRVRYAGLTTGTRFLLRAA